MASAQRLLPPEPPREPTPINLPRKMSFSPVAGGGVVLVVGAVVVASTWLSGVRGAPSIAVPAPVASSGGTRLSIPTPTDVMLTMASPTWTRTPTATSTPTITPPAQTQASPPAPSPTPTPAPTPTQTTKTIAPTFPDVHVAAGGRECLRSGSGPYAAAAATDQTTTCSFASSVWSAYHSAGLNGRGGRLKLAQPGSTGQLIVNCSGGQPALCSAGAGHVAIYGGRLIVG